MSQGRTPSRVRVGSWCASRVASFVRQVFIQGASCIVSVWPGSHSLRCELRLGASFTPQASRIAFV